MKVDQTKATRRVNKPNCSCPARRAVEERSTHRSSGSRLRCFVASRAGWEPLLHPQVGAPRPNAHGIHEGEPKRRFMLFCGFRVVCRRSRKHRVTGSSHLPVYLPRSGYSGDSTTSNIVAREPRETAPPEVGRTLRVPKPKGGISNRPPLGLEKGTSLIEHCFFRGSGLTNCWGGYAMGFAGPEFVEGLASRGFAARLWLRGVASPGFANVCSTNISDVCAPMLLNQVASMRKGAMKGGKRGIELQD